ncbi:MAG: hypothetical protein RLZZ253_3178 [Verrucomicrobiota bacterium]
MDVLGDLGLFHEHLLRDYVPFKKARAADVPGGNTAGRWLATTGLQMNKRMHPGRACQRRESP